MATACDDHPGRAPDSGARDGSAGGSGGGAADAGGATGGSGGLGGGAGSAGSDASAAPDVGGGDVAPADTAPDGAPATCIRTTAAQFVIPPGAPLPPQPVFLGDPSRLTTTEVVTRLARYLWQTEPDAALLARVAGCTRLGRDDVRALARSMLTDARANRAVQAFVDRWLRLGELTTFDRDPARFPAITPALRRSLAGEPRIFAAQVILVEGGTLGRLLTAPFSFVDDELARLYGAPLLDDTFRRVEFAPAEQRAGILTQPGVLAVAGGFDRHSGPVRAVHLLQRVMCTEIPPPPAGLESEVPPESARPGVSLRAAIEMTFQQNPACQSCHRLLTLGFALEPFDALGRRRTMDNGAAIDASAEVLEINGGGSHFVDGPVQLVTHLASSASTARCFARRWLELALGRDVPQEQDEVVAGLHRVFSEADLDIRTLIVEVTVTLPFLAP